MDLVARRRCRRSVFARGPLLTAAVVCAALTSTTGMTGCTSGTVGLPGDLGGQLTGPGGGSGGGSGSNGDDASVGSGGAGEDASASPPANPSNPEIDAGASPAPDATAAGTGSSGMRAADAGTGENTGSSATTFTLLDTNVNTIVDGEGVSGWDPIPENGIIDVGKVGNALSIRANTTPSVVASVTFVLDGTYTHTEHSAPYTLCSDDGKGDITPCPFTLGKHTLVATPAMASDAGAADGGTSAMPSTTLYFTITDSALEGGVPDGGPDAPVTL